MEEPKTRKMTLGQFYAVRSTGPITITQTIPAGTFTVLEVAEADGTGLSEVGFTSLTNSAQITAGEDVKYAITPCFSRGAASAQGSAEKIDVDQDYTPESTNPQSGTAVAQALGGYATTQALEERTVMTEVHGSELEDTSQMEGYSITALKTILGGSNVMPYLMPTNVSVTNNQTCPEDALVQSLRMVVCIPSSGTPGRVYLVPNHGGQSLGALMSAGTRQSLVGKVYYESPLLTPGGTKELVEVEFLPGGELAPVSWFSTSLWPCTGETAESVHGGAGNSDAVPRLAMQPYSQGNKLKEGYDAYFTFKQYPARSYTPIKLITGKLLTEAVPAHTDDTTAHLTAEEHAGLTELLENKEELLAGGGNADSGSEGGGKRTEWWALLSSPISSDIYLSSFTGTTAGGVAWEFVRELVFETGNTAPACAGRVTANTPVSYAELQPSLLTGVLAALDTYGGASSLMAVPLTVQLLDAEP